MLNLRFLFTCVIFPGMFVLRSNIGCVIFPTMFVLESNMLLKFVLRPIFLPALPPLPLSSLPVWLALSSISLCNSRLLRMPLSLGLPFNLIPSFPSQSFATPTSPLELDALPFQVLCSCQSELLAPLLKMPLPFTSNASSLRSERISDATTNATMRDGRVTVAVTVAKSVTTCFPTTSLSAANVTFELASVVAATDFKASRRLSAYRSSNVLATWIRQSAARLDLSWLAYAGDFRKLTAWRKMILRIH